MTERLYKGLGAIARQDLRDSGIGVSEFIAFFWDAPVWLGDACGCIDDRCDGGGFHHDAGPENCGCRPVIIEGFLEAKAPAGAVAQ